MYPIGMVPHPLEWYTIGMEPVHLTLYSDASLEGWGGTDEVTHVGGGGRRLKCLTASISQIKVGNRVIRNKKEIVENLNNYLVNVGPNTEKNIRVILIIKPKKDLKNRTQTELSDCSHIK